MHSSPSAINRRPLRRWLATGTVAIALLGAAACGDDDEAATEDTTEETAGGGGGGDILIGLITKTDTNPFFVKMKGGGRGQGRGARRRAAVLRRHQGR